MSAETPAVEGPQDRLLWIAGLVLLLIGIGVMMSGIAPGLSGPILIVIEVGIFFLLYALLVLPVNVQFGVSGLVNFGPVLWFGIGAYATAMLASTGSYQGVTFGLPWPLAVLVGVVLAILVGLLLGVTTLQLRGDFLAVVTLAAAEILYGIVEKVGGFGGATGIGGVPRIFQAGSFPMTDVAVTFILAGIVVFVYAIAERMTNSPYGRVLKAIRSDEDATEALGKPTFRYKVLVFVYGAIIMGLAGSLLALYNGAVSPGFITLDVTVLVWIGMLIGGAGNNRGVVYGLAIVMGLQLFTRFAQEWFPVSQSQFAALRLMIVGLLLVLIIRFRPSGIWGNPEEREVL